MRLQPFTPQRFRRRVFSQLWMLALQFVLGMVLNLVDGRTGRAWHTFYAVVLVAHILNAIGLVEGGVYITLKNPDRLNSWATAAMGVAFGAGILTARTGNDAWSFVMACGFLAAAWLYVMLYTRTGQIAQKT